MDKLFRTYLRHEKLDEQSSGDIRTMSPSNQKLAIDKLDGGFFTFQTRTIVESWSIDLVTYAIMNNKICLTSSLSLIDALCHRSGEEGIELLRLMIQRGFNPHSLGILEILQDKKNYYLWNYLVFTVEVPCLNKQFFSYRSSTTKSFDYSKIDIQFLKKYRRHKKDERWAGQLRHRLDILSVVPDDVKYMRAKYRTLRIPLTGMFRFPPSYLHINRYKVVTWMFDSMLFLELELRTILLAINYYDRYMQLSPGMTYDRLQLLAGTCLWVASKVEEDLEVEISSIVAACQNKFSVPEFYAMEITLLQTLDHLVNAVTIYDIPYLTQDDMYHISVVEEGILLDLDLLRTFARAVWIVKRFLRKCLLNRVQKIVRRRKRQCCVC